LHIFDAVAEGKPVTEQVIALGGTGWKENIHLKIKTGTPIDYVLNKYLKENRQYRIIKNSVLSGESIKDFTLPIDNTFSLLIAIPENKEREILPFIQPGLKKNSYSNTFLSSIIPFFNKKCETNIHGEERSCIFCNFCQNVCPVNIIPHLLEKYVEKDIIDDSLMVYGIFTCIECGLCSYVCPTKIPLMKKIIEGKQKLVKAGCDISLCIKPYFDLKGLEEYRGFKNKK